MQKPNLTGRRTLVVEDDFLLSADICTEIEACGGVVVGPTATLAGGYVLFRKSPLPDGGILNIRIGDGMVYPLADDLVAAGVPIIFASSENRSSIPDRYASVPLFAKPINMMSMAGELFPTR